jgi:hypothetical protein
VTLANRSLKTADAAEAKARFAAAWTESEEAFALARAQSAGGAILSQRDAEQIAARWFKAERDRLETSGRFTDLLWSGGEGYIEAEACMTPAATAEERGYEDIDFAEMVLPWMRRALRENNLPMPASKSVAHDRLVSAFVEKLHKLSECALKRHEGERQPQVNGWDASGPA